MESHQDNLTSVMGVTLGVTSDHELFTKNTMLKEPPSNVTIIIQPINIEINWLCHFEHTVTFEITMSVLRNLPNIEVEIH